MSADTAAIPVAFARSLRAAGIDVPVGSTAAFVEAVALVGLADETATYWAGRATLVRRPEDIDVYDRAFAAFWHHLIPVSAPALERQVALALDTPDGEADGPPDDDSERPRDDDVVAVRFSAAEVLRSKDLARCSPDELAEALRLMARMKVVAANRRSRRLRRTHSSRPGARLDLRGTVRAALRNGGEPIDLVRRAPGRQPRRLVLLIDVSGSMEPYARALVRFAHAAVAGRRRVEAFALGTRLTRLSRQLATRDPDLALRAASAEVLDWSGGTRLGPALREFNDAWGVRGLARGAVVVILSDGWDRGDPTELAEQMARLHRVAHRVIWVNPLKATPGYAPLAGGMAAALPYVDEFVEGHSLASLEHLAEVIGA
jgi:uncharacterized protein